MSVLQLDNNSFEEEVMNYKGKVLVDFYADWCGPCKMQSPIIDEIADSNKDLKVVKVNIDDNPEISEKFGIMSIPTLLIFDNGEKIDSFIGLTQKDTILDKIK